MVLNPGGNETPRNPPPLNPNELHSTEYGATTPNFTLHYTKTEFTEFEKFLSQRKVKYPEMEGMSLLTALGIT